jgi:penicillin-binding protein 1C
MNRVGSFAAAGMVRRILIFLQPDESRGINEEPFPPPRDAAAVRICPLSGDVAGEECPLPALEYFQQGTEPRTLCRVHRRFAVDSRTGTLAVEDTPPEQIVLRAFTVLPPEYAAWSVKHGYLPPPTGGSQSIEVSASILEPVDGSRFILDPEIPRQYQTFPLRTRISPVLPEVVWYVDGEEYERVEFPYETRWPLQEGTHTFQVRFPRARVASEPVSIVVSAN